MQKWDAHEPQHIVRVELHLHRQNALNENVTCAAQSDVRQLCGSTMPEGSSTVSRRRRKRWRSGMRKSGSMPYVLSCTCTDMAHVGNLNWDTQ